MPSAAPASQSPLLPDAVSAEPNASSATPHPHPGAASDPPRLLQGPAFLGRLSQKTNSKLFCQSKLRASHPAPGATTLPEQLWPSPPTPPRLSCFLFCSKESDLPGGKLEAFENPPEYSYSPRIHQTSGLAGLGRGGSRGCLKGQRTRVSSLMELF